MNYAYLYKYDGRNRCIAKKFPGAEWVYYVYDYSDQLIFTQDGEMRAKTPKQWMFSFPDIFGREALTGTCTNEMDYAANPLGNNVVRAMRYYGNNPYNGYAYVGTSLINPVILTTAIMIIIGLWGVMECLILRTQTLNMNLFRVMVLNTQTDIPVYLPVR